MRVGDGVHWNAEAHRKITNIILAHVSKAWGVKLPGRDRKQNLFMSPLDAQVFNCILSSTGWPRHKENRELGC